MRSPGKLIVLEGVDASGKTTQITQLLSWLTLRGLSISLFDFPRINGPGFGEIIARFLRGEFGPVESVSPFLIGAVFAADRLSAKSDINAALNSRDAVIVDRYVYSNIAFQCAKVRDRQAKEDLKDWLIKTEFGINALPSPDLVIYLRVPNDFVRQTVSTRHLSDRAYLKGTQDIHEQSLALQTNVAIEYEALLVSEPAFRVVDCVDSCGQMKSPSDISRQLNGLVAEVLELDYAPL